MDLIDIKRTEADKQKEREDWDKPSSTANMDDYPYGLTLYLDDKTLEKLGLSDKDFDTGEPVSICAVGVISEDAMRSVGGVKKRSMTIQLQKMAVTQGEESTAQEELYGK